MHSSYGTEETYGYVEYETQNYKYLGLEIGETFVIPGDAVVTNVDAD
ncbi:hypothetical protein FACS1894166_11370 [Bacilli bacterium]|nr:hypothetical protein FACS1894166_11370 [Bacilli bacterium]